MHAWAHIHWSSRHYFNIALIRMPHIHIQYYSMLCSLCYFIQMSHFNTFESIHLCLWIMPQKFNDVYGTAKGYRRCQTEEYYDINWFLHNQLQNCTASFYLAYSRLKLWNVVAEIWRKINQTTVAKFKTFSKTNMSAWITLFNCFIIDWLHNFNILYSLTT